MTDTLHVALVPAWASFFTPAQYGVFVALVEADLLLRTRPHDQAREAGYVVDALRF